MTQATSDEIIAEVRKVNERLDSLEKTLKELMIRILPEEDISDEEWGELQEIKAEMDRGEYITLDELRKKYQDS